MPLPASANDLVEEVFLILDGTFPKEARALLLRAVEGESEEITARRLSEEFKETITPKTVQRLINGYTIRGQYIRGAKDYFKIILKILDRADHADLLCAAQHLLNWSPGKRSWTASVPTRILNRLWKLLNRLWKPIAPAAILGLLQAATAADCLERVLRLVASTQGSSPKLYDEVVCGLLDLYDREQLEGFFAALGKFPIDVCFPTRGVQLLWKLCNS